MLRFILSRFATFVPTFIGVTLISFAFIRVLPGDPIIVMAGERGMTDERYAELLTQFGFDRPVWVQYWDYLTGVLQGDLGTVFVTKTPGLGRVLRAVPGHARAVDLRHHLRGRCSACPPA